MIGDDELLRARIHAALDAVHRPAPGLLRRCVDAAATERRAPRVRALAVAVALSLVAALVVVLTLLQHQLSPGRTGPVQSPTPAPASVLVTLDAQNQVTALDAQSLRVLWRQRAGAAAPASIQSTGLLALSPDGRTLWVLPATDPRGGTVLRAYDVRTGTPGATIALGGGAVYSAIAVDPRGGDVAAVGQDATRIVVTLVDPQRQVVLSTTATRQLPAAAPAGVDRALDARFSGDGTRLWYSYGTGDVDRTGIDWTTVSGATLQPCRAATPGAACAPQTGYGLALAGQGAVTTGIGTPVELVELGATGAVQRRIATGLSAGGPGDLALSADGTTATVLAPCPGGGGLARVDLAAGTAQAVATPAPAGAPPGPDTPCGVRATTLPGGTVAVARLDTAAADPNTAGTVDIVDPATGRILRSASLPADAIDLLTAP